MRIDHELGEKELPNVYNTAAVARKLAEALVETYQLVLESQLCRWNVTGSLFYSVRRMTEVHVTDMFAAVDAMAERIRTLDHPAHIGSAALFGQMVGSQHTEVTAIEMVESLVFSHNRLAARLRALVETAECAGDPVTADLAAARGAFHERAAWMLGATAK
ncbi:DNA starvation/stationary phase protection protein [Silicimonas algicola]|uniref:Starvation-inducible DNA-binding protein n=1 Tax=Silicimonas algicola TaxID=1826607 RepID=A0A316GMW3_9RHOB|nr:DNA starvation/stationary phase protection protein [Silicimonas algicola]AZQ68685.1 DNA starvation/stationary phase protection protein [Silicimonas algicola]PWK56247.1 starvation-inducible DNA-binding protein [Silicimonas algicola]